MDLLPLLPTNLVFRPNIHLNQISGPMTFIFTGAVICRLLMVVLETREERRKKKLKLSSLWSLVLRISHNGT